MSTLLISRILSYSVISLCLWVKLPQVLTICRAGSAEGLSLRGYWMDTACYLFGSSYAFYFGNPISTYAESILLAIQNAAIIGAILYYGKRWNAESIIFTLTAILFVIGSLLTIFPGPLLQLLHMLTLPFSIGSKTAQIYSIYKIKSKGAVSTVTWATVTYGCAARLVTTVVEVKDALVFLNFFVAFILNLVITTQCLYYSGPKKNSN